MPPSVAIVSAGEMGAAIGAKFVNAGLAVFTSLDGRSEATRNRARNAGMVDLPLSQLPKHAEWILSILPPSDAFAFARSFIDAADAAASESIVQDNLTKNIVFVDCNAVNPESAKRIAGLFERSRTISFIDAGIIGGPPSDTYTPTIYASAEKKDEKSLDEFEAFSKYGVKVNALRGEAGIGDASALKMSYAGISKGLIGIMTTMLLAAHNSSPATSKALLEELSASQPQILSRIPKSIPGMVPKAYRWVGEMEEIAGFVGGGEGDLYKGLAQLYRRIEGSLKTDGRTKGDIGTLLKLAEDAKAKLEEKSLKH